MNKLLALILTVASVSATAKDNWVNTAGDPWRNTLGECWRNGSWTPATAHPDCDGALKPTPRVQVTIPAPAPKVQAPVVPATPKPPEVKVTKLTYSTDTLFDFDKSVIKPEGRQMLDGLVGMINREYNEDYVVIAVGHTDWIGTDAYNMKLGQRRAEAVRAFLVSKGVEPKRVYVESKGEKQPVADNRTALGRAKNRRVEIEVSGTKRTN